MLQFLFLRAITAEQRITFIYNTLLKTLEILNSFIKTQNYLLEIEMLSYLRNLAESFLTFKSSHESRVLLKKAIEEN